MAENARVTKNSKTINLLKSANVSCVCENLAPGQSAKYFVLCVLLCMDFITPRVDSFYQNINFECLVNALCH